ncbi:MAG: hypothetical protein WC455_06550 [Dehalococcoidia bacterium]|jgi:hypothetical protein
MSAKKIRIIAVPPGEAPEHIRQSWIGVVIPLPPPPFDEKRSIPSAGVLSGPKTPLGQISALLRGKGTKRYGYAVETLDAVGALAEKNPEAAQWWYKNTSFLMKKGQMLVFPAEVCEEVVET